MMPEFDRIKSNIQKMIDQGASEPEIDQYVSSENVTPEQLRAQTTQPNPSRTFLGAAREGITNIPSSAVETASNIASAALHPIRTAEAVGSTVMGGLERGASALGMTPTTTKNEPAFDAFTGMLKQRYGTWDNFKNTLATDPVGVMMDASALLSGGASAVGKASDVGKVMGAAAAISDPLTGVVTAAKAISKPLIGKIPERMYGSAVKLPKTLRNEARNQQIATGLSEGIMPTEAGLSDLTTKKEALNAQIADILKQKEAQFVPPSTTTTVDKVQGPFPPPEPLVGDQGYQKILQDANLTPEKGVPPGRVPVGQLTKIGTFPTLPLSDVTRDLVDIPLSDLENSTKVRAALQPAYQEIIKTVDHPGVGGIDTSRALKAVSELQDFYKNAAVPDKYIADLEGLKSDFSAAHGNYLSPMQAQKIKQTIYKIQSSAYKNMAFLTDPNLKAHLVQGQKQLARGLKESLVESFPELANLNTGESHLIALETTIQKAIGRIGDHDLLGIGIPLSTIAGSAIKANAGLLFGAGKLLLDHPKIKAAIAIKLAAARSAGVAAGPSALRSAAKGAYQAGRLENSQPQEPQTLQDLRSQ